MTPAVCLISSIPSLSVRGAAGVQGRASFSLCCHLYLSSGSCYTPSSLLPPHQASMFAVVWTLLSVTAACPPCPTVKCAGPEHSLLCLRLGVQRTQGGGRDRGQVWGALAWLPAVGVIVPSSNVQALLWVRWGPQTKGNCEKYKLKPSQRLTAMRAASPREMVSTVFYC